SSILIASGARWKCPFANIRRSPSLSETHKMKWRCLLLAALLLPTIAFSQTYDVVIEGGRVLDPETNLDAVPNIGISAGKIARITADPLSAHRTISANSLVVAPGFIDLHQHGQDLDSQRVKALDGVTTALELEIGKPDVAAFLASKQGHSLLN